MNVPFNWFKNYIKVSEDISTVAKYFTSIGYMQDRPVKKVGDDDVLDLEVRQNRSDCNSLVGLARELSAVMQKPLELPEMLEELPREHGDVHVEIEDKDQCYRIAALRIDGIKITDSPQWMQERLEAFGVKVLNNVVDITNYVMIEFGLPMHAFDAAKLKDSTIIVRSAKDGEKLTLFGGKTLTCTADDLLLTDPECPVSSTMMGGDAKSVHDDTTSIILEAAVYNQAAVRRSSLRHSIRTESSTRLEKFLDPELVDITLRRAAHLIMEHAGGKITGFADAYPKPFEKKKVTVRVSRVRKVTGVEILHHEALDILNRLEIPTTEISEEELQSDIPYFRTDLEQEADLIEEIIRIHGYDTIPEHLPSSAVPKDLQSAISVLEEKIRDIMVGLGYDEQITEPLTHEDEPRKEPIMLENSLTSEKDMLRTTLDFSLLAAVEMRKKYRQENIALFEVGKIYFMEGEKYVEKRVLGGAVHGAKSYLDAKGDIEVLLEKLGYEYSEKIIHIDPQLLVFSIDLEELIAHGPRAEMELLSTPPSRIFHDFSLNIPEDLPVGDVLNAVKHVDPFIFSVKLGEQPRPQEDGTKTIFLKVSYSNPEGTLTEADVKPIKEKIQALVSEM